MTLLLVRHGETALNAARVLQPAATPLSATGLAQAHAIALRVAALAPVAVVTSDMPRALQTAQAIAKAAGSIPLIQTPLLHERNFGDLRGKPYDTLGFDPLGMLDAPPGGESWQQFMRRVDEAFDFVVRQRAALAGPLVVVTHGLVIRALLGVQLPLAAGIDMPERIGNTALTVAGATPPHAATLVNCTLHLQGAAAEDATSLSGG